MVWLFKNLGRLVLLALVVFFVGVPIWNLS